MKKTEKQNQNTGRRDTVDVVVMLPCPFCGESISEIVHQNNTLEPEYSLAVRCENCGAYGPHASYMTGAEKAWNERGKVDPLEWSKKHGVEEF